MPGKRRWIDISRTIADGMTVWPGDPEVSLERVDDPPYGAGFAVTALSMGVHAGTHVDAPSHVMPAGLSIDAMPAEAMIGPARVIEIGSSAGISAGLLSRFRIRSGERILLRAALPDCTGLTVNAAAFLSGKKIRAIGIDRPSISCAGQDEPVHRLLAAAGIWIIEGLDLSMVPAGRYDLVCLPIKLSGCEAAPARAFLRRRP